jgi:lysozyme
VSLLVGVHLDNVDQPPEASYRRLALARADAALALWTAGTRHRRGVHQRLRALGVGRVCVRVGDEWIAGSVDDYLRDVDAAVDEAVAGGFAEDQVDVQILNEPNLGPCSATEVGLFVGQVLQRWRRRARAVLPPVSRGRPGWQDYAAQVLAVAGPPPARVARAEHAYGADCEALPPCDPAGPPVLVTEFSRPDLTGAARGRWAVEQLRALSARGYAAAYQFILDGRTGGAWPDAYRMTDDEAAVIGQRGALPDGPTTEQGASMLRIIDISNYQGAVDPSGWAAAGIAGAVVRVSEDGSDLDPFAAANVRAIRGAGLLLGLYHVTDPRLASPVESLEAFQRGIDNVGGLQPGELLVNDAELGPDGDLARWHAEWGDGARSKWGLRPLLYSGEWFMAPHNLAIEGVAAQYGGLWLASWTGDPARRPSVAGWPAPVMVQWTSSGAAPGVGGAVDLNTFFGSREDWLALGMPARPAPQPAPAPADPVAAALADLRAAVGRLEDAIAGRAA